MGIMGYPWVYPWEIPVGHGYGYPWVQFPRVSNGYGYGFRKIINTYGLPMGIHKINFKYTYKEFK